MDVKFKVDECAYLSSDTDDLKAFTEFLVLDRSYLPLLEPTERNIVFPASRQHYCYHQNNLLRFDELPFIEKLKIHWKRRKRP